MAFEPRTIGKMYAEHVKNPEVDYFLDIFFKFVGCIINSALVNCKNKPCGRSFPGSVDCKASLVSLTVAFE